MKLRVLISILFLIATTFTAIHELEHIHDDHDSSSCQVCIVDDHLVSADIEAAASPDIAYSFDAIELKNQLLNTHFKKSANHSTAPPKIS